MGNYGIRIKGGVTCDEAGKFYAIIHIWDNPAAEGKPVEYVDDERFATEAEALAHYVRKFKPLLQDAREKLQKMPGLNVKTLLDKLQGS